MPLKGHLLAARVFYTNNVMRNISSERTSMGDVVENGVKFSISGSAVVVLIEVEDDSKPMTSFAFSVDCVDSA